MAWKQTVAKADIAFGWLEWLGGGDPDVYSKTRKEGNVMRWSLFSKIKFVILIAMSLNALTSYAAADEVQDLIKRDGKIPQAKIQKFMEKRYGRPTQKVRMLAPSLVKRFTGKKDMSDKKFDEAELESGSLINTIGEAPPGFGQTFWWDRKDDQILLLVYVNAANYGGVAIENLADGDQVIVGDISGIASFTEDTGNPTLAGIVGLVAAGAEVVATGLGAPELVPIINQANEFAQREFKASGAKHKKRDGYGVDPGSGHKAKQEGGVIMCLPGAGGVVYSGDGDHKERWIQPPGDRVDWKMPVHANGCFFPMRASYPHNARKVTTVGSPAMPTLWVNVWDWKFTDNAGYYSLFIKIEKAGSPQTTFPGPVEP